ncbi:MAG TPA: hypothetical protein VL527_18800 [Dongiaceae bacterium]|jgi:hypothetical protein|nr:hypothetical protein [Dongiaceae bacterium]
MIHALPGMGADQRMFPPPWDSLPEFRAHDWPRYAGEQTLAEVAEAMCRAANINDGDSLIGASLGGMVAGEITKIRRIATLYLVGSAVSREEISAVATRLHPLLQVAPLDWLRFVAGKIPWELTRMFAGTESTFIRAVGPAIFQWPGLGPPRTRVRRIHGRRDHIILPPARADLLLNGGHLIAITHARECVNFIQSDFVQ